MISFSAVLTRGPLSVRPAVDADAAALAVERDAESRRFLGDEPGAGLPLACLVVSGTVVGWIDADADDDRTWLEPGEVNVGYEVFLDHRSQGIATAALRLFAAHLIGLDPPLAPTLLIDPANLASVRVADRSGFTFVRTVDGELLYRLPDPEEKP